MHTPARTPDPTPPRLRRASAPSPSPQAPWPSPPLPLPPEISPPPAAPARSGAPRTPPRRRTRDLPQPLRVLRCAHQIPHHPDSTRLEHPHHLPKPPGPLCRRRRRPSPLRCTAANTTSKYSRSPVASACTPARTPDPTPPRLHRASAPSPSPQAPWPSPPPPPPEISLPPATQPIQVHRGHHHVEIPVREGQPLRVPLSARDVLLDPLCPSSPEHRQRRLPPAVQSHHTALVPLRTPRRGPSAPPTSPGRRPPSTAPSPSKGRARSRGPRQRSRGGIGRRGRQWCQQIRPQSGGRRGGRGGRGR
ncbi:hypothetical protein COCNU_12G003250 [Cocos nucifera]|uniref:Uncharacterized protein n=1 Tax=Cocos nucifera TaxID=13894 RepID=A0A8K0IQU4_COCNU|nr:hypothetical protein COCNU_12G003250 [Cocos nucifera]